MMPLPSVIAIDGPAGSGKSTISYRLAEQYHYLFVDTGIFYRTLTLVALRNGVPLDDEEALTELAEATRIEIQPAPHDPHHKSHVFANGVNVTDYIRTTEVEAAVSTVSAVAGVRYALQDQQRLVAEQGNIIMAGRDIGSAVLPDADLKFYIDASLEERARRRHQQRIERGQDSDIEEIKAALARRDKIDTERAISPLVIPRDAIYINTDDKTIDETVETISQCIAMWEMA